MRRPHLVAFRVVGHGLSKADEGNPELGFGAVPHSASVLCGTTIQTSTLQGRAWNKPHGREKARTSLPWLALSTLAPVAEALPVSMILGLGAPNSFSGLRLALRVLILRA